MQLFDEWVESPVCVAPTAMQKMAHPEGEAATARGTYDDVAMLMCLINAYIPTHTHTHKLHMHAACANLDTCMILSSWSTTSLEEVAKAGGTKGLRWFQLYVYNDKDVTRRLIQRAERAGYKALVVTVDTPVLGKRIVDARNGFNLPPHLTLANFDDTALASKLKVKEGDSSLHRYTQALIDPGLTWDTIRWVQGLTKLPVLVKGVLTAEDALEAVEHGVKGIVVSNHGARQLDGVPATVSLRLRGLLFILYLFMSLFLSPSLPLALSFSHYFPSLFSSNFYSPIIHSSS